MDSSDMPVPAAPGVPDLDKWIDRYIHLRDRKREIEARHKEELAPYNKLMSEVEGLLLDYMQKAGLKRVAGAGGTAYQSTKLSASIKDGAAFRTFVISNQLFNMIDWRANANAVFEYIAEHEGTGVPGVNPTSRVTVNFRRPNEQE